ncbi:MAG: prepilin-type N-terminal cleavage/methylation domain-containing protein [Candidatus Paceibacterota bacterium]
MKNNSQSANRRIQLLNFPFKLLSKFGSQFSIPRSKGRTGNSQFNKGFTILEIIIVLLIVLLVVSVTVINTGSFNRAKLLEAETQGLVEVLELAKKKVASGDTGGCTSDLTGYKVAITSVSAYELRAACTAGDITISSYSFPASSKLQFSTYNLAETVFSPLSAGASANCVIVQDTSSGKCQRVDINSAGSISVKEGVCTC